MAITFSSPRMGRLTGRGLFFSRDGSIAGEWRFTNLPFDTPDRCF